MGIFISALFSFREGHICMRSEKKGKCELLKEDSNRRYEKKTCDDLFIACLTLIQCF